MQCKLTILISDVGKGTNLQAIIDGIKNEKINARILAIISDSQNSPGIEKARENFIPVEIISTKEELLPILKKLNPDYVCLDGWKQIILDEVIDAFPGRILNTHPGLIPDNSDEVIKNPDGTNALWNKGKLAEKAMQNFLDNHSTFAGCSNHFLTREFDFGPVLGRVFEKIQPGDTVESLYTRLKIKENEMYVNVLAKLCIEEKGDK